MMRKTIFKLAVLGALLLLSLLIQWKSYDLSDLLNLSRNFFHSLAVSLWIIVGFAFTRILLISFYRRSKNMKSSENDNIITGITNIYYVIIIITSIWLALTFFGVSIVDAITSLSIVAAGLAILFKEYIANMISGFLFAFGHHLSIGDWVKIGDQKGKVLEISLSHITLLDQNEVINLLPNHVAYNSNIVNYTNNNSRASEFDLELSLVKAPLSIGAIEKELKDLAKNIEGIEADTLQISVNEVYHNYVSLKAKYCLKPESRDKELHIKQALLKRTVEAIE